jgi:hypothetical protein
MTKLPVIALASAAAVALAGTAAAASRNSHVMNVPLPDGSVAHVQYVGNVPPRVTVEPVAATGDLWSTGMFPSFAGFDRMFEQMNREMRQVEQMAGQPLAAPANGLNVASYGSMPAGTSSVSVVSVSNGGATCTRTTEVVSQGPGKPPKVTSNVSGNCGSAPAPAPQGAPASAPIDHT